MREIKARIWDKEQRKMCSVASLDFGQNGSGKTITAWFKTAEGYDRGLVAGESGELMFFTGLLDKNGKEICEGDIVRVVIGYIDWDESESREVFPEDDERRVFIEKVVLDPCYGVFGMFKANIASGEPVQIEVIGNIYMNPELLKL